MRRKGAHKSRESVKKSRSSRTRDSETAMRREDARQPKYNGRGSRSSRTNNKAHSVPTASRKRYINRSRGAPGHSSSSKRLTNKELESKLKEPTIPLQSTIEVNSWYRFRHTWIVEIFSQPRTSQASIEAKGVEYTVDLVVTGKTKSPVTVKILQETKRFDCRH
ncbi:hypothetical protein KQX54_009754 [Cotesia glomerata]|uniref:Uncharacterized protein n=1 Tax=Cotesia glomerata TaxID=32391 RepID=A0AAV7HWL3_COTGL|nr:hypothetical protein KQX54_009754 [Cotesia glomerata]